MTWREVPLGSVVTFLDHLRRPITEKDRVPGPVPYFGANGQQDSVTGFIFDEPLVLLAEDGGHFDEREKGVAYPICGPSWVNNHAHVLRPKPELNIAYLARVLENRNLLPFISGSTRGKLTKSSAERIPIPLPPLPEQRRIAEILDRADVLRAKRRQAMTLLDELAESTFNEVFGNIVRNDRGWKTAVISDFVAGFTTGKSVVGSGDDRDERSPRVLKISSVTTGTFLPNESKPLPIGYTPLKSHFIERGDLLFSRANTAELVGATAYVLHAVPRVTLPDKLWKFAWKRDGLVDPVWVWKALSRPEFRRVISDRATGSGGSMKNISQPVLLGISIALPPFQIQEDFARRILEIECLRESHSIHLSEFDELFASLQHRAFRGEL
ncbi:restriction endonuclease subunit S [Lacisediminihabitans sp. H27-G8]|uniref:restriction endonuclease subunit S n=1 Tax=Lacisediminihabitans sp. H27-G8 TaxID=3111909 RepID=UPI0038FC79C0